MTKHDLISYVFGEAAKSNIEKRKVGCVITNKEGRVLGKGYNTEDLHAEMMALQDFKDSGCLRAENSSFIVYVTHQPCPACADELMLTLGINTRIEVIERFIKFDGDKVRYDLVPPSAIKAMAEVLTFGARKYKPNNWKNCEDPERYLAALYRHLEAWRAGEINDQDSGMHHLAHAMTNLAFILELKYNPTEWSNKE